jgi:uncharacterized protein YggE
MRCELIGLASFVGLQSGIAAAQPMIQAVPERPRVVVDGYGEVKTAPDLAIISYTARGEGSTSDDAVRAMTLAEARIASSLRTIDSNAGPRTGDVKVTPVKSDDCKEQDYGSPQLSAGPCAILGYVATQSVTVRTAAVKNAGTMVGLAGRGGGFDAQIERFDLQDPRSAQRQATAAALDDAASKAGAIAQAGHLSLGKILSINTSSRPDGQEIVVTGILRRSSAPAPAEMPPPVAVPITPLPITTTANLIVTYAIDQ